MERGEGEDPRALGDELVFLDQREQGAHDLHLRDGDDLIEVAAAEFECKLPRRAHGTAVCNRVGGGQGDRAPAGERSFHAGGVLRLNTDDLHLRVDELHCERNAGGKSAAADGHEDRVHILERVNHLEGNRALTDEDIAVIEGMNVDKALLLLQLKTVRIGIVKSVAVENDRRAERACCLHFQNRRCGRHADDGIYAEFL